MTFLRYHGKRSVTEMRDMALKQIKKESIDNELKARRFMMMQTVVGRENNDLRATRRMHHVVL